MKPKDKTWESFKAWSKTVSLPTIKEVPGEFTDLVRTFREEYARQLENFGEGYASYSNAMIGTYHLYMRSKVVSDNSCPKCMGHGHIMAYSHIMGGVCFDCKGTGKLKSA